MIHDNMINHIHIIYYNMTTHMRINRPSLIVRSCMQCYAMAFITLIAMSCNVMQCYALASLYCHHAPRLIVQSLCRHIYVYIYIYIYIYSCHAYSTDACPRLHLSNNSLSGHGIELLIEAPAAFLASLA